MTETVSYRAGDFIFKQGDVSDVAYLILEGTIHIERTMPDGTKRIFELQPGQFFGEYGVMDDAPRSATARAKTDVRLERKELRENW